MTNYHQAAYTLDKEIPEGEEVPLSAGHDPEDAELVKELSDQFREGVEQQAEADAEKAQEWAERDPKPTPSELEIERGLVPAPDEDADSSADKNASNTASGAGSGVDTDDDCPPDGTVTEVLDWVGDDPDRAQQALDRERDGQNRATLIAELEKRTA